MNDATSIPLAAPPEGIASQLARFLHELAARSRIPFRIVFANGGQFRAGEGEPAFTLHFRTRRAELAPALFGHVGILESYFAGELDVEGDFALAFRAAMDAKSAMRTAHPLVRVRNRLHELRFSNASIAQAKANAEFHYDLPYDFYKLWLDRAGMLYTCALLAEGTQHARGGAGQQDGPRVPQGASSRPARRSSTSAAASAASCSTRSSNTARSAPASTPRREQLADLRGRGRAPRACRTASSSSSATSAEIPGHTTSSCRSARSSTPGATSSTRSSGRTRTR